MRSGPHRHVSFFTLFPDTCFLCVCVCVNDRETSGGNKILQTWVHNTHHCTLRDTKTWKRVQDGQTHTNTRTQTQIIFICIFTTCIFMEGKKWKTINTVAFSYVCVGVSIDLMRWVILFWNELWVACIEAGRILPSKGEKFSSSSNQVAASASWWHRTWEMDLQQLVSIYDQTSHLGNMEDKISNCSVQWSYSLWSKFVVTHRKSQKWSLEGRSRGSGWIWRVLLTNKLARVNIFKCSRRSNQCSELEEPSQVRAGSPLLSVCYSAHWLFPVAHSY